MCTNPRLKLEDDDAAFERECQALVNYWKAQEAFRRAQEAESDAKAEEALRTLSERFNGRSEDR